MAQLKFRIPNISKLDICPLVNDCPSLTQFLLHSTPNQIERLFINSSPCTPSFECESLCSGLAEAVRGVTHEVWLKELVMSGPNFETLVKASSTTKTLVFFFCKIDSCCELDLSGPDYRWVEAIYFMLKCCLIQVVWTNWSKFIKGSILKLVSI